MSRLPIPTREDAPASSQPLLDAVDKQLGTVPNLFRLMSISPAVLQAYLGLGSALGHSLDARTRERIAIAVAQINGCNYCLSAHSALGRGAGLSDSDIADARRATSSDPKLAAILDFARTLVLSRGHAGDQDLAGLRALGLGDAEILEIVGNTVLNIFTNYINNAAGTEVDFPLVEAELSAAA